MIPQPAAAAAFWVFRGTAACRGFFNEKKHGLASIHHGNGQDVHAVVRLTPPETEQASSETEGELFHLYVYRFGNDKVTKLMDEYDDS